MKRTAFELLYISYFVLHIPITFIVDAQSILPPQLFPPWAKQLVQWHVRTNQDWLVGSNPLWFQSMIVAELVFQLPCFVLLTIGLMQRKSWTRMLGIIYGVHAATTFVPILGEILFGRPLTAESLKLSAIYLPYLLMPAGLALRMALHPYPSQPQMVQALKSQAASWVPKAGRPGSLLSRPFDLIFVLYFFSHVPITLLFDSQSLFPSELYPAWATGAMAWHSKVNSDHLVVQNPTWFVALVVCECLVQLPTFFVFTYAFMYQRSWIRIPALIYGVHVSTTLIPIMAEFLFNSYEPKFMAALVYSPWLLLPFALAVRMVARPYPNTLQAKMEEKMR